MAFPVVEAVNESNTAAAGTSHVVALPGSIAAGDLLIVIIAKARTAAVTINALAGWTELLDENVLNGMFVAYRWADGTEGASVTFTSSAANRAAHLSFRISGAVNPATQAPELSAVNTGTSNAPDPNSLSPTGGAKDYLWITFFGLNAAGEEADDDTWCNNAATNYGNLLQKSSGTGGTNVGAYLAASRRTNNATSEDAVWPTGSTDQALGWRAYTLAIHPVVVRQGRVSWAEFEVPNSPRQARVSWAEFEVPDALRRASVSWAEFEVPNSPRLAQVSWAEFEVPDALRKAQVSWAELETPDSDARRALVSWAELEIPNALRYAQLSWAEFEVPEILLRKVHLSYAEFEVPDIPGVGGGGLNVATSRSYLHAIVKGL